MSNNKIVSAEMLRDAKNCLPKFFALGTNVPGKYAIYKCVSHLILENPVNVIYLEDSAIIESVITLPKSAVDKITHVTLARNVDKNVYSIHRWIYTLNALNIKSGSVPLLETGKFINIIEFK